MLTLNYIPSLSMTWKNSYDHREQYAEFTSIFQNAYNGDMTL